MKDRKIDAIEYTIVSNCLLGMWLDGHLKDREYNQIMDRVNEYARKCGIRDKAERTREREIEYIEADEELLIDKAQFEKFNKSCMKEGDKNDS